ncbi:MAG: hypothetical protein ACO1SV_25900 [Fimbriimonas sp.]
MERLRTEAETPIAPHEVRELLTRLNETSVESLPVDETRTLGGLAVETGIPFDRLQHELDGLRGRRKRSLPWIVPVSLLAATVGIGGWLLSQPLTTPAASVPPVPGNIMAPPPDMSRHGLVELSQVDFGPDSGSYMVEPTFQPINPIHEGISLCAGVDGVLWGSGNRRMKVLKTPLTAAEEAELRKSIEELLAHVRTRATKRKMPTATRPSEPTLPYEDPAYTVNLMLLHYYGLSSASVPIPPSGVDEAEFRRLSRAAAKLAVDRLQWQLRFHANASRPSGP